MTKIKVLVVDDSAVIRKLLSTMIDQQPDMEVVGTASDPYIARDKIKQLNPDVITLDIEMPRMDGLTFLRNLMRLRPMPVIMISTLTQAGADITLESLNNGAFDCVSKPRENLGKGLTEYEQEIADKIRAASKVNLGELERRAKASRQSPVAPMRSVSGYQPRTNQIIAIGASTGGTEAIKDVLMGLPENCPPVVITQHIPVNFSASYAQRLDGCCAMTVHEAQSGQKLLPGNVYIAPGDQHLVVRKSASGLSAQLLDTERVNRHKPSVEVLFDSITQLGLKDTVAVLLTGMGADGAEALLRMKQIGCHTIIQDQATSVVWGMPGVAHSIGAHCEVKPLGSIAKRLLELTNRNSDQGRVKSSA